MWYYAINNQRQGPVAPEALRALLDSRTINSATLVWRDGLATWVPLSTVEGQLPASANRQPQPAALQGTIVQPPSSQTAAPGDQRCVECGQFFPSSEVVILGGKPVCAGCKSIFVQKLREGVRIGGGHGLWKRGKELVAGLDVTLPSRCVKCDADTSEKRLKRSLYWHHPALYLMILFPGLLIYAIVAACVRKRTTIHVALCDRHQSKRKIFIASAWLLALAGIGAIFVSASQSGDTATMFIPISIILIVGAIMVGAFGARVVQAKKIDDRNVYVRGVCRAFLDKLPEWND